jgi:hypothetical protein
VQIKNRQQLLTILTLTAVGLLIADKIISPPLMKLWRQRSARIVMLQQQVKDGEALRRGKESLRSHWAMIQSSALTNNPTLAEQQLWTGLNRWTQLSGVSLDSIAPIGKPGADASYKTLDCRIDASGSLDQLSQFLYALETDPMALKVQSVELTTKDNNGSKIGLGVTVSGLMLTGLEPKK